MIRGYHAHNNQELDKNALVIARYVTSDESLSAEVAI